MADIVAPIPPNGPTAKSAAEYRLKRAHAHRERSEVLATHDSVLTAEVIFRWFTPRETFGTLHDLLEESDL